VKVSLSWRRLSGDSEIIAALKRLANSDGERVDPKSNLHVGCLQGEVILPNSLKPEFELGNFTRSSRVLDKRRKAEGTLTSHDCSDKLGCTEFRLWPNCDRIWARF
jgi:hypothetical protein